MDGRFWRNSSKKFFLPVKVMSAVFRGKFLDLLTKAKPGTDPQLIRACREKDWVVYCKPPFSKNGTLDYIARYTHRVAISANRIVQYTDSTVAFTYRDYRHGRKKRTMTISREEFIRRFLLHILPKGFRKIRHYGLYASRDKKARLQLCRVLTKPPAAGAAAFHPRTPREDPRQGLRPVPYLQCGQNAPLR